ncbi:hypothetical protein SKAU_G00387670 [Synaphobranchus kaupii]|uniref:Uncharacterized protein n=1 Tax=Synaphobranchus kaupii TaxID=118154 RepID=A0A9Q1EAX1_SYNKA|nr:hypothetical protein SKAU_G00387670 [Synaphobranchus kaupii]
MHWAEGSVLTGVPQGGGAVLELAAGKQQPHFANPWDSECGGCAWTGSGRNGDKASDPPREKRMRGAESDHELYQLVQQSAAALHSLKKRQSSETVLWAQSVAYRLDSLPPFERAQARVRIEQVLLEAEVPGGRSQVIEESGGRMFLNL